MENELTALQQQLVSLGSAVLNYLPYLLGGILVFFLGRWVAKLVAKLLTQVGERIGFNELIEQTGISGGLRQANIKQSPLELTALLIYWLILLNVLLIALDTLRLTVIANSLRNLISFLPQILVAVVILVVGALVAQFIGRVVQAAIAGMGVEFHEAIGQMVRGLILIVVVVIAMEHIGLDATLFTNLVTYIIAIIVAGLALAFGLGGRQLARNVLAGFYARDMFKLGDRLIIDGQEGVLIGIGSMNTELLVGEERLVIPNTQLTETAVRVMGPLPPSE
ncbi:MAG: mechanosensitive ion channel [Anaerolineales bacterium]|nr:mechanosensitive ion channel [Anaerolineales bacterium]